LKSKYENICKDCGKKINIGDEINKNKNDNWCISGENCQATQQGKSIDDLMERKKRAIIMTEAFIKLCKEHGAEQAIANAATVWNTEAMRK